MGYPVTGDLPTWARVSLLAPTVACKYENDCGNFEMHSFGPWTYDFTMHMSSYNHFSLTTFSEKNLYQKSRPCSYFQ